MPFSAELTAKEMAMFRVKVKSRGWSAEMMRLDVQEGRIFSPVKSQVEWIRSAVMKQEPEGDISDRL